MNGDESPKRPDQAVLRTQLTELNVRSRWYVAQLWQVPLAFIAATAIPLAQLATKENGGVTLTLGLIGASMVGFSVFFHLLGVRADAKRAVEDLKEIEKDVLWAIAKGNHFRKAAHNSPEYYYHFLPKTLNLSGKTVMKKVRKAFGKLTTMELVHEHATGGNMTYELTTEGLRLAFELKDLTKQ